jgi:hypothetical protein
MYSVMGVAVSIALEDVRPSGQVSVEHIENVLDRLNSPPIPVQRIPLLAWHCRQRHRANLCRTLRREVVKHYIQWVCDNPISTV